MQYDKNEVLAENEKDKNVQKIRSGSIKLIFKINSNHQFVFVKKIDLK